MGGHFTHSMMTGTMIPPKSQPSGGLPYPEWYYNPVFTPHMGTVNRPRLYAKTNFVPGITENNPGNTIANRYFDYTQKGWYIEKYNRRRHNAEWTRFDPLNYLTGERFPIANRGSRVIDIGSGATTTTMNPKRVGRHALLDHKFYVPQIDSRPSGVPIRI